MRLRLSYILICREKPVCITTAKIPDLIILLGARLAPVRVLFVPFRYRHSASFRWEVCFLGFPQYQVIRLIGFPINAGLSGFPDIPQTPA
jgi:hypothetical protein